MNADGQSIMQDNIHLLFLDLDKFINQNPDYAEAYGYRARAKFNLGRIDEAKSDAQIAEQLADEAGDWVFANEMRAIS